MQKKQNGDSSLWNKNFLLVFFANFITISTANMFTSPYTLYLTSLGGTKMQIGVAAFIYAVLSLAMKPVAAWFLDNRSRKKIYIFGLLAGAGLQFFYIIAPLVMLIVLRGFHGLIWAIIVTGATTNGYDTINPKRFSEGVGYMGFANALATTLTPTVGLWIYNSYGPAPFFITLSVMLLISIAIMSKFKFEHVERKPAPNFKEISIIDLVIEKSALPPSVLTAFAAIVNAGVANYIALYMLEIGSPFGAGMYFMMQGLGTFVSRTFMGRVMDKKGEEPIIIISSLTLVLGLVGLIFAETLPLFFIGSFFLGVCIGMTATCMQIMSVSSVPKEQRAKAASTYSCCWELFYALGGLFCGVLVTVFTYKITFAILTVMGLLYYIVYKLWVAKTDCAFRVRRAKAHEALKNAAKEARE